MCGRFLRTASKKKLEEVFDLADVTTIPELEASYNIPPSRPIYVVGYNKAHQRRGLAIMNWGFIPRWWSKSLQEAHKPINATAEGILEKPTFRESFQSRRCIIPSEGFYEWKKEVGPYYIKPKDFAFFPMAGIWDAWVGPDKKPIYTCAIITTTANERISNFHHRMPVILPRDAWETWFNPATPMNNLLDLLKPYPSELMDVYRVSKLVNKPTNDGPECMQPVEDTAA